MSNNDNKAIAERVIQAAWNEGDVSVFRAFFGPDMFSASPQRHARSAQELQQMVRLYRAAFPDLHVVLQDLLADGDKVAARFAVEGTHRGVVQGVASAEAVAGLPSAEDPYRKLLLVPPTGRLITFEGIAVLGFSNSKVTSFWALWDELDVLRQLGALPMVGSAPVR